MPWFADWFNSPYYHILYKDRDENEGKVFIDNLDKLLKFRPEHKILDLACGKGRHAIYLNSKGYDVTGADLSSESIAYASQFENERLHFLLQDMRQPFAEENFNFVLNLFTSFGYFKKEEDNINTLASIAKSLTANGKLVLDFFNAEKVIRELVHKETKVVDDIAFHITKELVDSFIIKTIQFNAEGIDFEYTEKVQALTLENFRSLCVKAGLTITATFGNYELDNFDPQQSERLILVAGK